MIINIMMHHPVGFPSLVLPESVNSTRPVSATTKVIESDEVLWTGLTGLGPVQIDFPRGSPFNVSTVALGTPVTVVARKGLFPYDVKINGTNFPNGGALEVEPKG